MAKLGFNQWAMSSSMEDAAKVSMARIKRPFLKAGLEDD